MTRDDIVKWAQEAAIMPPEWGATENQWRSLEAFANLVAAAEREWQGLTENEIKHLWYEACQTNLELTSQLIVHLARNIEAKLKERNT